MQTVFLIALLAAPTSETSTHALSLADAVDLALRHDPTLASAGIQRDRAQLGVLRAQLDRLTVKVGADVQELWDKANIGGSGPSPSIGLGLSNASANLIVPIFSGFRVESNVARTQRLEDAAKTEVLSARKDVALAVARAYWALRKVALLAVVQTAALERLERAQATAEVRVRAGLAPPIDLNRARARHLAQDAVLADLRGSMRSASAELGTLLGVEGTLVLTDQPHVATQSIANEQTLLDQARENRTELRSALFRLDAGSESVTIAKSGYYPELDAFGLLQYGNNPAIAGAGSRAVSNSANPFNDLTGSVQLGVQLSINVFDTLNTYTAVRDAEYDRERLHEEWRRIARSVESEVKVARAKVLHFDDVRTRLSAAEDVAKDNVEIIRKRYENGESLVFELLDSEIELLDIQRQLGSASADLQLASLELDASLGIIVGEKS